jgi:hypothetical protein
MAYAIPVAMAVGAQALQGVSAIQQGNVRARQATIEGQARADELARQAQLSHISGEEQQASRMDDLSRTMGTIDATIGSRGLDLSSPSAFALRDAAQTYAQRDVSRIGFNSLQTGSNYEMAGRTAVQVAGARASMAKAAGYTEAVGSLFKAASYGYSGFSKPAAAYSGDGNGEW